MTQHTKEVTLDAPLALRHLIVAHDQMLREYQAKLLGQTEEAVLQMMNILNIKPEHGWKFDMQRMVYVRQVSIEEEPTETA